MCVWVVVYFCEDRLLLPQKNVALLLPEAGHVHKIDVSEEVLPERDLLSAIQHIYYIVVERLDHYLARPHVEVEEVVLVAGVHEPHEIGVDLGSPIRVLLQVALESGTPCHRDQYRLRPRERFCCEDNLEDGDHEEHVVVVVIDKRSDDLDLARLLV